MEIAYVPKRSKVSVGHIPEKVSKFDLLDAIEEILKPLNKSTCLNLDHMPDRIWLVNVLYTIKPDHQYFKYSKAMT